MTELARDIFARVTTVSDGSRVSERGTLPAAIGGDGLAAKPDLPGFWQQGVSDAGGT